LTDYLRTPEAIRERSENVLRAGLEGELEHFAVDLSRLDGVAREVAAVTRAEYPDLVIPLHGRLRHFAAGGVDRLALLDQKLRDPSDEERARTLVDLVVTSVLLDAGAGPGWSYREKDTGLAFDRSEGLAVASFHMFRDGAFSHLDSIEEKDLARGFQVRDDNPLVGLPGRAALLRSLAAAMKDRPEAFGSPPRPGNLLDAWRARAFQGRLEARLVLDTILVELGSIWPNQDVWPHPSAGGEGPTAGLVPFHKLSQWLTYSLIEPVQMAGVEVTEVDALTGLAEYRNGGLFVDRKVLEPKRADVTGRVHEPGDEAVVEWRALTVALLDRVAQKMREELGMDRTSLPLAKVLEGGTWRAGRKVALELRENGAPPIRVQSDGTLF
jgi:hypothetical protein